MQTYKLKIELLIVLLVDIYEIYFLVWLVQTVWQNLVPSRCWCFQPHLMAYRTNFRISCEARSLACPYHTEIQ